MMAMRVPLHPRADGREKLSEGQLTKRPIGIESFIYFFIYQPNAFAKQMVIIKKKELRSCEIAK